MTLQQFNNKAKSKFSDQSYGFGRQRIKKTVTTYYHDKFMIIVSQHDKDTKIEYFNGLQSVSLSNFINYIDII